MVQARVLSLPFLADLIHENGLFWPLLDNLVKFLRVYITFKLTNPEHLKYFRNVYCVTNNHNKDQGMPTNHKLPQTN